MKKKSIVKAVKSTAATAKKVAEKIVKKPAALTSKAAAAVKKPAPAKAPAVKAPSAKSRPTVVIALVDVGFGNALYIRGEGAGLSWEKGLVLDNVGASEWSVSLPADGKPVAYKLLLNDVSWSAGEDYTIEAGSTVSVSPSF